MEDKILSLKDTLSYSVGNLGYGVISQMITSYLVFYTTVILKMPGSLIGLIIGLSVFWDGISDPIMGYISDTSTSKFGRRHFFILMGTILVSLTNLLLWHIDVAYALWLKFLLVFVTIILIKTFITIFVTPYSALGAELSSNYQERSMVQAIKTVFFLSAIILVTAGGMFIFFRPTARYANGQLNPEAYRNMAITCSLIMMTTGLFTYFKTKKFKVVNRSLNIVDKFSLKTFYHKTKFSVQQRDYRAVFIGYMFTNLATAIISTIGLHTYVYTFALNNTEIGIVVGVQFITSILTQPIWAKIANKIDKNNAVRLGLKLSVLGCLLLFVSVIFRSHVIEHFQFLLIYALTIGFSTSGLFSIPLSMVADTVDQQEYETGDRNEGIYYGLLTFGYKISQGIAIVFFGTMLDIIKFNPDLEVQMSSTSYLLGTLLAIGSLLTFVLSYLAYSKYTLDESKVRAIQSELKVKLNDALN